MTDIAVVTTDVAIVGMALRFPGASSPEQFWRNLQGGVESISSFSEEELIAAGEPLSLVARPDYVRAAGILEQVDHFDAALFDLTPREAELMDPQHRLLLECAWEALEASGHDPHRHRGPIGLFAGSGTGAYRLRLLASRAASEDLDPLQVEIGNDRDHLVSQIAYRLNLRGPGVTVQTGCSTSLVAVHLAVQSLLSYECDLALAGGVSLALPQVRGHLYQVGGVLSPDGHCRAFDARAQGTVVGSGAGVVVLRRLADALAGDQIHAVIKGSAVNNDGKRKVGYTAPSIAGQAEVIAQALAMAGLSARDITYVEAHGTGTVVGDPIEMAGLQKAYASAAGLPGSCAVGSVKTNLGHLNAAAGVAGLIKTVLMLQHRQIPPSLHFERLNPEIDLGDSPFFVNAELRSWETASGVRRAGVSSFSIGGTNAHLILEEAPLAPSCADAGEAQLLVLSAKTAGALAESASRLSAELHRRSDADLSALGDVAYTLQIGRRELSHRRAVVSRSAREAAAALAASGGAARSANPGGYRPVVFFFPGQGAQHPGMGRALYRREPVFRREIDRGAEILVPWLGRDLRSLLFPAAGDEEEAARCLADTAYAQPALFLCEHALARLWMSWGVCPEAMLGHSVGEYVAACLAGVFTLEDAFALVALRGRLLQELPPGAMLAVALAEEALVLHLNGDLSLAAVNGPTACVASGSLAAVIALEERLAREGTAFRRLPVTRAFHSALVEPAIEPLVRRIAEISRNSPTLPWLSNVTGNWIAVEEAVDPAYWGRHLRRTVRFSDGLEVLLAEPSRAFLEIGPGDALTRLARRHPGCAAERVAVPSWGAEDRRGKDDEATLAALGQLWVCGAAVDWPAVHSDRPRRRVTLPIYPFERRRFWIDDEITVSPEAPSIPASSNGGTHALPKPAASDVEREVAAILQQLLGVERIGDDDDFFALGGHSLLAVQLVNRLRGRFQVDLPLSIVFEAPTVRGLAARIVTARSAEEAQDMEELLREIEGLSGEELRQAIMRESAAAPPSPTGGPAREIAFTLMFFSDDGSREGPDKYRLLLDSARFADRHGFAAIWTPERHFQSFGGLYPNPSVLSAALAMITERLEIRAGSLVLPLHNPIRVAEDWLLLDNLSGGRVALSLASGWHPDDFSLAPAAYAERRRLLFEGVATLRRIWAEGRVTTTAVGGGEAELTVLPRPLRPKLPIWITTSGTLETWRKAGEIGANVLTGLYGDLKKDMVPRIELYRRCREEHGHDPAAGRVTVMLHTFLGPDLDGVREAVREPMKSYLKSFLAQGNAGRSAAGSRTEWARMSGREQEELTDLTFASYFGERALLGTPESCVPLIRRLQESGIDEVACLVDFGLAAESVLAGLSFLDRLRERSGIAAKGGNGT